MSTKHGALVVVGSGPGIGRNVGALFAERGFEKIVLMSRNESRLQEDAAFVSATAPNAKVEIVSIDLADSGNVQTALKTVDRKLEGVALECVLFNAARLGVSPFLEFKAEDLENDLKVWGKITCLWDELLTAAQISVVNMYKVAQWAMPQLFQHKELYKPAFLCTSGMLYKDPFPAMFSLAACKAAQYNLVHSLHKEYEPKGVHCGLIVVGGRVSDASKVTNARNCAEETWKLYDQPKGTGDLEVIMLDPDYLNHIKQREQQTK